jgi:hypothetical protein
MPEFPDIPDIPTHVVPMDQPNSPEWAQQDRWNDVIRQLCVPCKEHGTYPVRGEQILAMGSAGNLAMGKVTVHCSNQDCKYYAGDYSPIQWNDLMRK